MKKLILHIGYHKTATTTLQNNLFNNLHKDGYIEYLNHIKLRNENYKQINVHNCVQFILGANYDKSELKNELNTLKQIDKNISLISNENISLFHKDFSYLKIDNKAIYNSLKIKELFSEYFENIEIIIVIRAQSTLIPSFYAETYNQIIGEKRSYRDIGKWVKENFLTNNSFHFNYDRMYEQYANTFGENNIHVLIYEDLLFDKNYFYGQLSKIFKVDFTYIKDKIEFMQKQNVTPRTVDGKLKPKKITIGAVVTQPIRYLLKKNLDKNTFNAIKKVYNTIIPKRLLDKRLEIEIKIRKLDEREVEAILKKYYKSNLSLINKLFLDKEKMKKYNYI
jgi:hypothetical protein